ncbi:MAG TPA: hypothetical protein PLY34_10470 [Ferruginibacter sp.]|nr:hypothetical protein [Ferruginibacter sp.]
MQSQPSIDTGLIRSWVDEKLNPDNVEARLKSMQLPEEQISAYLKEFKKERYAGRRMNGFLFAGLGAVIGFISCLLSIINPVPELYNLILFGLTSVAILLICLGLYFLFE